jgi:hypothetical protein
VADAKGDVVAFTDDHVYADRRWLRALGARFALDPALGAVTGLILPAELESPAQVWFERYYGGFGGERSFRAVTLEAAPSSSILPRGARVPVRSTKAFTRGAFLSTASAPTERERIWLFADRRCPRLEDSTMPSKPERQRAGRGPRGADQRHLARRRRWLRTRGFRSPQASRRL